MQKTQAKHVRLELLENPIPLDESQIPDLTKEDYEERIKNLWLMPEAKSYEAIIIYGDREHFSNIHYFTGYDPRWEESLLILKPDSKPYLLVGNEGIGYVKKVCIEAKVELYQTLSLMGQPNSKSRRLDQIMSEYLGDGTGEIGIIGFKVYDSTNHALSGLITDIPYYMVETLKLSCPKAKLVNATDLMADCDYGLKHTISPKEAVHFEAAGTKVSRGIYQCLKHLKVGMTELEAARFCDFDGSPINMHPNINFGDYHVSFGLNSPTAYHNLNYADSLGVGYGLRGSLVHRAGMYIRSIEDLPEEKRGYIDDFLVPYFDNIVSWYEMLKIGTSFGDIYEMVEEELGLEKFGCTLNPGHLTHTDEWTNSPFCEGSTVKIHSGMAIQCDYTVTKENPFMSVHVEDGLLIADKELQKEIEKISPAGMKRIQARKDFIVKELHINLPEEVLPLSDLSCICFPFMADLDIIMVKEERKD